MSISEFIAENWLLVTALIIVVTLLTQNLLTADKHGVDPLQAVNLINHENAVVLDVRPTTDFQKGHIIDAINIPGSSLKNQIKLLNKHKNKPIIVNCRSGAQSQLAVRELRSQGFEQVYNLNGGILAWQSSNMPVVRG